MVPFLCLWSITVLFFTFLHLLFPESSVQSGSVMVPLPPGERESWGAIGGIVVLVILVVLLLALLLLYRRRQKDKQNNTPTVSFSTTRTVNSEYAVPGTEQRRFPSGHKVQVIWLKIHNLCSHSLKSSHNFNTHLEVTYHLSYTPNHYNF